MTREDPQMKLRLPAELKDRLAAAADDNSRSLNAEVVLRLEESFSAPKSSRKAIALDEPTIDALADRIAALLDDKSKRPKK